MGKNKEEKQILDSVADELLNVLKKAVRQSKDTMLKTKKKVVSTEYDEELKKPMQEITSESEEITTLKGMVDINSLKIISGLLRDVCEITGKGGFKDDEKGIIVLADIKDLKDEQE